MHNHPLYPYNKPPAALEAAFAKEGWGKRPRSSAFVPDLTAGDILNAIWRERSILQRIAVKHVVLRRVREICKLYQQKWQASGPLATLDSQALDKALSGLVAASGLAGG